MTKPVLAVLGGSFSPPHLGHAMLPSYLLARGLAARVLIAPCWEHAFAKTLAPFERRVSYLKAAMKWYGPAVEVSEIERALAESDPSQPSYTLRMLDALAQRHAEYQVRLVVGSDIIATGETERWHRWHEIESRYAPIVVPRAGYSDEVVVLPAISSTQIRQWLEEPERAEARIGLEANLPAAVLRLIDQEKRDEAGGEVPHGVVWIVGHGHVASHGRSWLEEKGFRVRSIGSRALLEGREPLPESGEGEAPRWLWLLCRDPDLEPMAECLARGGELPPGLPVVHGAGARLATDVLAALREAGHPIGALHPICSLRKERSESLLGTAVFGIEGGRACALGNAGGLGRAVSSRSARARSKGTAGLPRRLCARGQSLGGLVGRGGEGVGRPEAAARSGSQGTGNVASELARQSVELGGSKGSDGPRLSGGPRNGGGTPGRPRRRKPSALRVAEQAAGEADLAELVEGGLRARGGSGKRTLDDNSAVLAFDRHLLASTNRASEDRLGRSFLRSRVRVGA